MGMTGYSLNPSASEYPQFPWRSCAPCKYMKERIFGVAGSAESMTELWYRGHTRDITIQHIFLSLPQIAFWMSHI